MSTKSFAGNEERPKHSVIFESGDFEIRKYEAYYVVATDYDEGRGESTGDAFRRLFGYISGDNKKSEKVEMTAPVTIDKKVSEKIEMTAPVTLTTSSTVKTMTFMIPSRFYETAIPEPTNEKVKVVKVESQLRAVVGFSWIAGDEKKEEKTGELKAWLNSLEKYEQIGEPIYAGYNSPYTLPWLKTHEMMIEIKEK